MKYIMKLTATSLSVVAVLVVVGIVGFIIVAYVKKEAEGIVRTVMPRLAASSEINSYQAEGYVRTLMVIFADTQEERVAYRKELDLFSKRSTESIRRYQETLERDKNQTVEMRELIAARTEYQQIREHTLNLCDGGQVDEAKRLAKTSLWQAYQRYSSAGDTLMNIGIHSASSKGRQILRVCFITQVTVGIFGVVIFVGGFLIQARSEERRVGKECRSWWSP